MPTPFQEKVYSFVRNTPKGKVTTYGEIGRVMGTKAYRAIGQALRCNPYAPQVPCHRVVASDGSLHGFRGSTKNKALDEKSLLLRKEGIVIINDRIKDFNKVLFKFT